MPKAVGERPARPGSPPVRLGSGWCGERGAQPSGSAASLDLLWVRKHGAQVSEPTEIQLRALNRLTSVLGVQLYIEESEDIVAAVADFAKRHGSTLHLRGRVAGRAAGWRACANRFRSA